MSTLQLSCGKVFPFAQRALQNELMDWIFCQYILNAPNLQLLHPPCSYQLLFESKYLCFCLVQQLRGFLAVILGAKCRKDKIIKTHIIFWYKTEGSSTSDALFLKIQGKMMVLTWNSKKCEGRAIGTGLN